MTIFMKTVDDEIINIIIKNVVQQLQHDKGKVQPAVNTNKTDETTINELIITEETLSKQINGQTEIIIGVKSIITPSGKDYLRSNKISWRRQKNNANQKLTSQQKWKVLFLDGSKSTRHLFKKMSVNMELVSSTEEAAKKGISTICRGNSAGVVVMTSHPELVCSLANRNNKVRAAVVQNVQHWEEIKPHFTGNLFCINPVGRNAFELRNLLKRIV